ncbi:MAG: hypothetical protein J6T24_05650 [Clostridia bacterium]|nr:hypothetical protein [Clostridia bacterium]
MKTVRELDIDTLTARQKLGLLLCPMLKPDEKEIEAALAMIREHRLGAVWVSHNMKGRDEIIARVKEAADYPILIMCDAEDGHPDYPIPGAIALSAANEREEYAYSFGRVTSTAFAALGYNVICNPILDRRIRRASPGAQTRSISPDREVVARLGEAIIRGMHDGGTLSVAKHFPSPMKTTPHDTHLREGYSTDTKEELIEDALYPYRRLIEKDLIDGVMVGHKRLVNIDPDRPATLSRPVVDILREIGFDGFAITDALAMMAIVSRYGNTAPVPMSVEAGCDIPLITIPCEDAFSALCEAYGRGMITEKRLDAAARHVLAAQHKVTLLPKGEEIRPEDAENIKRISRECISAVCAEGLTPTIPREGHHLFVLMTEGTVDLAKLEYDAFASEWYNPRRIADTIRSLFPNSAVITHPDHPNFAQNWHILRDQLAYDDVVYVTYYKSFCYIGRECLTPRTVDIMDALQSTDRIVAHLHFGNPYVATDAPYVPRVLLGCGSADCIDHTLRILAGEAECLGKQPYAPYLRFHEKGDIIE